MSAHTEKGGLFGDLDDLLEGAESFDDLKAALTAVELKIAEVHQVKGRRAILADVESGKLAEDNLIMQWNALYSAFRAARQGWS